MSYSKIRFSLTTIPLRASSTIILAFCFAICFTSLTPQLASAQDTMLERIAPSDSLVYVSWLGMPKSNAAGNPTEKWMAQKEIQASYKKLIAAIDGYLENNPPEDPIVAEFLKKAPSMLETSSASFFMAGIEPGKEVEETLYGGMAIKLNEHEKWLERTLATLADKDGEGEIPLERVAVAGQDFYKISLDKKNDLHIGITNGHCLMAFGANGIKRTLANLDQPAPEWISETKKLASFKQTLGMFHFSPAGLIGLMDDIPKDQAPPEFLHLEEFQAISGQLGLDETGFATHLLLQCPKEPKGILSVLGSKPITIDRISEMPGGVMSAAVIQLDPKMIWSMMQRSSEYFDSAEGMDEAILDIESYSGLDFESEIVDSFDGFGSAYSEMTLSNPTGSGVIAMGVKDPKMFADRLGRFRQKVGMKALDLGVGSVEDKQYKDYTISTFTSSGFGEAKLSWCLAGDKFYIGQGAGPRVISAQLRRIGRTKGRLVDNQRIKDIFAYGKSRKWGEPVMLSHVDVASIINIVMPLAQTFVGGQRLPGFDFGFDDLPSAGVLSNGVESNVIAVFRTDKGFHMVERSTLPGGSTVATSGIMIGMLLPAVQQVRHAARRATTMNNMRQLQLAIHNYESANKKLPPAYSVDKDGKPLLSWRVHILPYLDESDLYDQFHLDEPWDSAHNKKLLEKMPAVFDNPANYHVSGKTTFLGVAGDNGAFGVKKMTFADIKDGLSNTVSIVDVNSNNAVEWTSPKDLDPDEIKDLLSFTNGTWGGSSCLIARCDGSTELLDNDDESRLREMMHRSDGSE